MKPPAAHCPRCKAAASEPCIEDGHAITGIHPERIQPGVEAALQEFCRACGVDLKDALRSDQRPKVKA